MSQSESRRDQIRAITRDVDIECPHCGFNLRDTDRDTCVECGERLLVRELVRGAELPRTWEYRLLQLGLAAWLVGSALAVPLAPLVMPAGSAARPAAAGAAALLFAGLLWWTVRLLRHPRGLMRLSRHARQLLIVINILTLTLFAGVVVLMFVLARIF